jgi:hypothetical protein
MTIITKSYKKEDLEMLKLKAISVIMRSTDLLEAFGLAVSEKTFDVRLVIKDDYCIIQTYNSRNELVGESNKIELIGRSCNAEGVYRFPLFVFETILAAVNRDLEKYDVDITALVFDEENKATFVLSSEGKVRVDYYHKVKEG